MEQTRIILAIVLSFLVFLIWDYFFVVKEPIPEKKTEVVPKSEPIAETGTDTDDSLKGETGTRQGEPLIPKPEIPIDQPGALTDRIARTYTIDTKIYTARLSEKGSVLTGFKLKNYREKADENANLKEMITEHEKSKISAFAFSNKTGNGIDQAVFTGNREQLHIDAGLKKQNLILTWMSPEGIEIEKEYQFSPDSYLINLDVRIKNRTGAVLNEPAHISITHSVDMESSGAYGFEGPSAYIDNSLNQIKIKNVEENERQQGQISWTSIEERYFMVSLIPKAVRNAEMRLLFAGEGLLENQYRLSIDNLSPGTQKSFAFDLFIGPKSLKILSQLNNSLDEAIDFGWFDFIAKPCLWLMNAIYQYIPNYGVAIIILTIFIKILLWPLGNKSYKSMSEMKKLQPLMAEIREKHKGNKKKMNEEMMSLYKVYKINPMGGCLPMILQIPVFIAFYRMLYEAIELRHAPFFGWINDLSAPDRLFNFGFSIPFMQPPYGIPVLTIIMGATMFLQQRMSPPPGDPAQAKMMMFLPIVFTVIFINFSSGLVLYWLVNNIISIAQQYYVSKKTA